MKKTHKPQKERRAKSDARIIASAIRLFGNRGYTYTSLADIAKEAGVTGPLLSQRYGSKEKLFLAAYIHALTDAFSDVDTNASPRECLYSIIKDTEKLSREDPAVFAFCNMLHNASDYPKKCLIPYQDEMKNTNNYKILKNAQEQGMLPAGEFDTLLASIGAIVFHIVGICERYHLEHKDPDKILEFIRFNDQKSMSLAKWNRVLETAIANTFDMLVYRNIPENTGEILKHSEKFRGYEECSDIRQSTEWYIDRYVSDSEKESMMMFLNLDTLGDRLKGKKSISYKSKQEDGSSIVYTHLPISWDKNGNLVEVLSGIYQVPAHTEPELIGWQRWEKADEN